MKREFQVRFRENVRVKFPCVTRLCATKPADINKTNRHTLRPHKNKKQTSVDTRNAHSQ
jgi:hypothetical protein